MFQAQRIQTLKNILLEKKSVEIAVLTEALHVSDVTVRKYLDKLEDEGFLKKMHGGAILCETSVDDLDREEEPVHEIEQQVADLAMTYLEDGDSIFIGPGFICTLFAKKIGTQKNITVITNNVNALEYLVPAAQNVYFMGGQIEYKDGSMYSSGNKAIMQLEGVFVQKAFIMAEGIDFRAGITINDFGQLEIIRKVREISRELIVMAGYNKFNKIGLHHVMSIDQAPVYVTNKSVDKKYVEYFYENNIKLLTSYNI